MRRTGKIKADRKRLRRKGFKFRDKDENVKSIIVENERKEISSGTSNVTSTDNTKSIGSDAQVMSYFTLPAEYAFVARAISQLDGSCKSLDPEFDFISNAAPYIVEIKGADLYLKDELLKFIVAFQDRIKECLKKIEDVFRSK
ncbi:MAG: putative unusual protein kinase regulating ubiquinone biosynthesis (AarF/ABC1/UbiB family) [Bacillariaceae sp.]